MSRWLQIKTLSGNSEIRLGGGPALNHSPCVFTLASFGGGKIFHAVRDGVMSCCCCWRDPGLTEKGWNHLFSRVCVSHFYEIFGSSCFRWNHRTIEAPPWRRLRVRGWKCDETTSLWQIRCSLGQLPAIRSQGKHRGWRTEDIKDFTTERDVVSLLVSARGCLIGWRSLK